MLITTGRIAEAKGRKVWQVDRLPAGGVIIGTIADADGHTEALILMPNGELLGGIRGKLSRIPPPKAKCVRCGHEWVVRSETTQCPKPGCRTMHWKNGVCLE